MNPPLIEVVVVQYTILYLYNYNISYKNNNTIFYSILLYYNYNIRYKNNIIYYILFYSTNTII